MIQNKDYTKYEFKPEEKLELSPGELTFLFQKLDIIIEDNIIQQTDFRFDKIHKETGELAKKTTSKKVIERDYKNVFNPYSTLQAVPKKSLNKVGLEALGLVLMLNDLRTRNIDAGKGSIIESKEPKMEVVDES